MAISAKGADRRKARVRKALKARAFGRPRLSAFSARTRISTPRSSTTRHGRTLAAASTLDKDVKSTVKNGGTAEAAATIGKLIAERGTKAGVAEVIFDRGSYIYHGRVKALADAAREGGLQF